MSHRPPVTITIHKHDEIKIKLRFPEATYSLDCTIGTVLLHICREYNAYVTRKGDNKISKDIMNAFARLSDESHINMMPDEVEKKILEPLHKLVYQLRGYWT